MSLVDATSVMALPMVVGNRSQAEVQTALDWASDIVESYCERSFAQVLGDVVTLDPYYGSLTNKGGYGGDSSYSYGGYPVFGSAGFSGVGSYGGRCLLPNPPVTGVTSVQAWLPVGAAGNTMSWVDLQYYNWTEDGLLYDTSMLPGNLNGPQPSWPTLPGSLKVTYDHGFVLPTDTTGTGPALPSAITDAVIRAATTYLANPAGFASLKVGDVSFTAGGSDSRRSGSPSGPVVDEVLLGRYRLVGL